ncbi:MAG TPA: NAD(P)H-dependent oxidoreductase [Candidatus Aphodovivens excrementavium]|nr:NAD(P)H-dependent oxidoreductase [Candidatus Aphodovivens excrementavium]
MNRVIVVGSPRVNGRSAALADELLYACIEECPDDVVSIVSVASTDIRPCTGCDACAGALDEPLELPEEGDPLYPHPALAESDAALHRCVIEDDMPEVRKHLDAADELIVVSPVYFAGAPAQFKCLLDRLQPYFRSDVRTRVKRPLILHVVGEGGDPHGYDPLVGTVMSAFSVAGFQLESIFDWVGKISAEGEILGDPEEYALAANEPADPPESAEPVEPVEPVESVGPAEKPRLSLSQPPRQRCAANGTSSGGKRSGNGSSSGSRARKQPGAGKPSGRSGGHDGRRFGAGKPAGRGGKPGGRAGKPSGRAGKPSGRGGARKGGRRG